MVKTVSYFQHRYTQQAESTKYFQQQAPRTNIVAGGTVAFESELAGAMESSGYVDTLIGSEK